MKKEKLAVMFPGIGYTCDRPLLYYSRRLAEACGYEVRPVPYGNFQSGVKGNVKKMEESFYSALAQAEELLWDVDFSGKELLFFSKSVGTVVSAAYAKKYGLEVRSVSFTPVEQTFRFAAGEGIMFHGTADPWAGDNDAIRRGCEAVGQRLYTVEGADHSLETGDVTADIRILQRVMEQVREYIAG